MPYREVISDGCVFFLDNSPFELVRNTIDTQVADSSIVTDFLSSFRDATSTLVILKKFNFPT